MQTFHYLYKITNIKNGRFYIGIHSTNNLDDGYFGSGKILTLAVKKYGKESFKKEIISFHNSREEVYKEESRIVTAELALRRDCYNLTTGGIGSKPYKSMSKDEILQRKNQLRRSPVWKLDIKNKLVELMSKYNNYSKVCKELKKSFDNIPFNKDIVRKICKEYDLDVNKKCKIRTLDNLKYIKQELLKGESFIKIATNMQSSGIYISASVVSKIAKENNFKVLFKHSVLYSDVPVLIEYLHKQGKDFNYILRELQKNFPDVSREYVSRHYLKITKNKRRVKYKDVITHKEFIREERFKGFTFKDIKLKLEKINIITSYRTVGRICEQFGYKVNPEIAGKSKTVLSFARDKEVNYVLKNMTEKGYSAKQIKEELRQMGIVTSERTILRDVRKLKVVSKVLTINSPDIIQEVLDKIALGWNYVKIHSYLEAKGIKIGVITVYNKVRALKEPA